MDEQIVTSDLSNLKLLVNDQKDPSLTLPLRRSGFDDDKTYVSFIKNTEKLVRNCIEYRDWTKYIKDVLGYSICLLTQERNSEVTVEIHHHPVSLYNICKAVINMFIQQQKEFCSYDIALEVIGLHYQNRIGYIPLVSSIHEKFHNGFLKLPIEFVQGDYRYLLEKYYFEPEDLEIISGYIQTKKEDLKLSWAKDYYPGVVNA